MRSQWSLIFIKSDCPPYRHDSYNDLLGTTQSASTLPTGYGTYAAQSFLRSAMKTEAEEKAHRTLENTMKAPFYQDAHSANKVCSPLIICIALPNITPANCIKSPRYQLQLPPRLNSIN